MASDLKNVRIFIPRAAGFPQVNTIPVTSAVSIMLSCIGDNAVDYRFINTGETGRIESKEVKNFIANGDPITDSIEFTFNGSAEIELTYATGTGTIPPGGGATAANQLIVISYLNGTTTSVFSGNDDSINVVEVTAAGAQATDVALAVSLFFQGEDGTLDGVTVPDKYVANFSGTMRNEVSSIPFTVPTSPDGDGNQRVIITYSKI